MEAGVIKEACRDARLRRSEILYTGANVADCVADCVI